MINLLKQKIREHLPLSVSPMNSIEDNAQVSLAAGLLQISDYNFFKISYVQWYGTNMDKESLENVFRDYLYDDSIPHYVRHFSREVLCLFNNGTLDPKKYGIVRPRQTPETRRAGIIYTIMLFIILVLFLLLITDYVPYS